jgi:Tol biopolymer transport system component
VQVALPRQGDPMLSPSGTLLATRINGRETTSADESVIAAEQAGYALYALTASSSASPTIKDLGRICVQGGKPTFSFDERWMVFHRYVTDSDATDLGFTDADDAAFQDYKDSGSSNLYLLDLKNGGITRLTNMPPGKFALFPHFRSDGWIYFVVRTVGQKEYFAATDAAILRE